MKIIPIAIILVGLALWRFPARAAFNRRNQFGVEQFNSYGHMRRRRTFETLMRVAGVVMILVGFGRMMVPDYHAPTSAHAVKYHARAESQS